MFFPERGRPSVSIGLKSLENLVVGQKSDVDLCLLNNMDTPPGVVGSIPKSSDLSDFGSKSNDLREIERTYCINVPAAGVFLDLESLVKVLNALF